MENDLVAVQEEVKIEMDEVKLEAIEMMGNESFKIEQSTLPLTFKEENYENADRIIINSMKSEPNDAYNWNECDMKEEETFEIPAEKIKLEMDQYYENFGIEEMTEEPMINKQHDCSSSVNSNEETVLNSAVKQEVPQNKHAMVWYKASKKSYRCNNCEYSACCKYHLIGHLKDHKDRKNTFLHSSSYKLSICIHCGAVFKCKQSLDRHTTTKHTDFIASVSSKILECSHCPYKTTKKCILTRHVVLKHPEVAGSYKSIICIHCNSIFRSKQSLDDHTIKKHPDFMASVSNEIYHCMICSYKTAHKINFSTHISFKHPERVDYSYNPSTCVHCNAKFGSKRHLDDHIIKIHPEFIRSISNKIYECAHCSYRTVIKNDLVKHMLEHPESANIFKMMACMHCNVTFCRKLNLDEHIIRKHPELIATVSSKIHECTHCSYQTALKNNLDKHLFKHSEVIGSYKVANCIELNCNAKFKNKKTLDNHIMQKHPAFIKFVSSKILECTHCEYKTTIKSHWDKHMLQHSDTADSDKLNICAHCNAKYQRKQSLDDHIIRKHPDFIASVSRKVHECSHCTYKTTMKSDLNKHLLKHSETADKYELKICIHCNAKFTRRLGLDDHIIKKHPEYIASVCSKIHECAQCTYKTTIKSDFDIHMSKHNEKLNMCMYCNAMYHRKQGLDDHIIRIHPEFISSVSRKVHECTFIRCTYKTTWKSYLDKHMLKHFKVNDSNKPS